MNAMYDEHKADWIGKLVFNQFAQNVTEFNDINNIISNVIRSRTGQSMSTIPAPPGITSDVLPKAIIGHTVLSQTKRVFSISKCQSVRVYWLQFPEQAQHIGFTQNR